MSGLAFSDIDDAVLETQELLIQRGAFLDLQTDLSQFVAVEQMWKNKKKAFAGGQNWRFDAQIDHNHSAKAVKMYETDTDAMTDVFIRGYMEPRHVNAHYVYDKREPDFQRGGTAIVDLVKSKYIGMMISFYELLEEILWGSPSATDEATPHGLTFWIQKGTDGQEGFYGLDPSGYEAIGRAHILSSAQARWANWFADYAAITKEDLVRKMRKGHRKTQFRSPVSHAQPNLAAMGNGIYTNDSVIGIMEEILEDQNMNLGTDLDSMGGKTLFKGTPIQYAPKLDDDTSNPIYMVDWKWMAIGVMQGWENNLTAPYAVPNMHLVSRVDLDATLEMICTNLRRQAVFAVVA
jgi:hypothetical protein